jgi:formate/nitrite transporter FocA (FNT family)
MRFLSLKSRLTTGQAFAWAFIAVVMGIIFTDGTFQAYVIYQKSIDYVDFCLNLLRHWVMNLIG